MIHPESRTLAWIETVASKNNVRDIALVEKTIRAFSLLEALVRSECPLLFKGGSSLLLHFDSNRRLSIDIDVICPPGTRIENYIEKYSAEYGFGNVELVQRISRTHVPKQHAKFFYEVSYPTGGRQDKILLDVLFEESHYSNVIKAPIQSRFLKQQGEPVMVKLPSKEDLLGDKLTAFAPHTTGIPFFKGEKNYSMEICKQLFDIATLFDSISDLTVTTETFRKFVSTELQYRNNKTTDLQSVLNDIYDTALCIMQRGLYNPHEFELLQDGIKRVRGFIHSEVYSIDSAITNAAKAAYLSKLIEKGITDVKHYNPEEVKALADAVIQSPLPTKLNKLKKSNIEAFFYLYEIQKLQLR